MTNPNNNIEVNLLQQKLQLEIDELKRHKNKWSLIGKAVVPVLATLSTGILGYVSFFIPFDLQKKNQENETLIRFISQATTAQSSQGRIAGIWMLDSYWDKDDSNAHKLIVNALTGILMSDEDPLARLAAAEVIGNAYEEADLKKDDNKNTEKLQNLRFMLYGDGTTGQYGTLTSANWWLKKDCIKQAQDTKDERAEKSCQDGLLATKEAIRKNWENLENAHLGETDLSNARLYKANLSTANLYKANLRGADLYNANLQDSDLYNANLQGAYLPGADLRGADLSGADLSGANIDGVIFKGAKYTDKTIFPQGFNPK
ncbi:MAG: pentapeptide repeat-containing protein [Patescibacteria group bacterium]